MDVKVIEVAIIGGGQAGLALSHLLTELDRPHVIVEQRRVVESWRTKRWDSLRMIAPNWSLVLPGFAYPGDDPDDFMAKDEVVQHLEGYARSFHAPIFEGTRATSVERHPVNDRFLVQTEDGTLEADQVILATGALQQPKRAPDAADLPATLTQMVAADYRNSESLPRGGVLIVGSGETGCQIAEELARSGGTSTCRAAGAGGHRDATAVATCLPGCGSRDGSSDGPRTSRRVCTLANPIHS
jgi:putative flavoprotein involved in K+ transport